jgi:uncharacterized protein (TIGR00369 family)
MVTTTPTDSTDFAQVLNDNSVGWVGAMGLHFLTATADEVTLDFEVSEIHHQGYGIVHGGVHAGVIETMASVGAALYARRTRQGVVGLENNTSFIRAVRSGRLRATATPITRGRRTQVWEGRIVDEDGKAVAIGRVRLLCLEPDGAIAGEEVSTRGASIATGLGAAGIGEGVVRQEPAPGADALSRPEDQPPS